MLPRLALAGGAWLSGGWREAGLGGRDGEEFGQIAVEAAVQEPEQGRPEAGGGGARGGLDLAHDKFTQPGPAPGELA